MTGGWRRHRETRVNLNWKLVHVVDNFLFFQLELNHHRPCSHICTYAQSCRCVCEGTIPKWQEGVDCMTMWNRVKLVCLLLLCWYYHIWLNFTRRAAWFLLSAQNVGWSGYRQASGWMGCLIWNIHWQQHSIDHIMEIVMVYDVLPSPNCFNMSSVNSMLIQH